MSDLVEDPPKDNEPGQREKPEFGVTDKVRYQLVCIARKLNFQMKLDTCIILSFEPHREKNGFLNLRKQRRRSASR